MVMSLQFFVLIHPTYLQYYLRHLSVGVVTRHIYSDVLKSMGWKQAKTYHDEVAFVYTHGLRLSQEENAPTYGYLTGHTLLGVFFLRFGALSDTSLVYAAGIPSA